MTSPAPLSDDFSRLAITFACILASMMVVVDSTIASVALPHMQATTGVSAQEVMWVLTSYMVATAIAMPLSGWLAERFGRKRVMVISLAGFTGASLLCGVANDLATLVLARTVQGLCGAGMQPLAQATLLDITPPERHARVLAVQGMSSMIGPLFGPTLGGWLTDTLSWRWVFLINLPLGVMAWVTLVGVLPASKAQSHRRFDGGGFAMLALAVASLQLFLDRGDRLDWLDATECRVWLALVGLGCWFTVVHTLTGRTPFVRPEIFRDRNFTVSCILGVSLSLVAFGTQPITVFLLQGLMGFTALHAGTLTATSSFSSLLAAMVLVRPLRRVSVRLPIVLGIGLIALSQVVYAATDLDADQGPILVGGLIKGAGMGMVFTVLPSITFATLPPGLRNEAAAFNALARNLGMSLGISLMQVFAAHETAWTRARLVEGVRPDNPLLALAVPGFDFAQHGAVAAMSGEIARQALMEAYVNAFFVSGVVAVLLAPMVLLVRLRE